QLAGPQIPYRAFRHEATPTPGAERPVGHELDRLGAVRAPNLCNLPRHSVITRGQTSHPPAIHSERGARRGALVNAPRHPAGWCRGGLPRCWRSGTSESRPHLEEVRSREWVTEPAPRESPPAPPGRLADDRSPMTRG